MIKQAALFLALSLGCGALRQLAPNGLSWMGRWPTSSTSAQEAYTMMTQEGDPAFVDLATAIRLEESKAAFFIDARSLADYKAGHVPGARSLPFYELDTTREKALAGLPMDSPLVLYCEGIDCELSIFLGRELKKFGYTNLKIFYGGAPEWKNAGLRMEK